ncbi:hypothetical protein MAPG_08792 [Magnaporthiopsis poae ATCC 64411]|uniref:Uncharacterized protein n=1 Tax=Magnaporthiopsis poae (strain ATCC 64411 / 73-15) TaxID=644358 RepID=A0A0C4E895_MAGP6|nr:hypothetical protein MAPG_08792 [Magnaporthiopsis poae ATCC 64411]
MHNSAMSGSRHGRSHEIPAARRSARPYFCCSRKNGFRKSKCRNKPPSRIKSAPASSTARAKIGVESRGLSAGLPRLRGAIAKKASVDWDLSNVARPVIRDVLLTSSIDVPLRRITASLEEHGEANKHKKRAAAQP